MKINGNYRDVAIAAIAAALMEIIKKAAEAAKKKANSPK